MIENEQINKQTLFNEYVNFIIRSAYLVEPIDYNQK